LYQVTDFSPSFVCRIELYEGVRPEVTSVQLRIDKVSDISVVKSIETPYVLLIVPHGRIVQGKNIHDVSSPLFVIMANPY